MTRPWGAINFSMSQAKENKNNGAAPKPPKGPQEQKPKGVVRADPNKAAVYKDREIKKLRKQLRTAQTSVTHANAVGSKKPAHVLLARRRRRGIVKNDWGLSNRADRLEKRRQVMLKRIEKRRAARHALKERRYRESATVTPGWGAAPLDDGFDAPSLGPEEKDKGSGESWWGPVLDAAKELAPTVLPLIAGMGDYEVDDITNQEMPNSNTLAAGFTDGEMCGEIPMMHSDGASTRVVHREYIGDVYSTTASFEKQVFAINPGLADSFTWLSSVAPSWEAYRVNGMMVCFNSEGSEYTNAVGLGYVALASQYDVTAPSFVSKKDMLQSQFCVARKPSKTFAHWIECAPHMQIQTEMLTRTGPIPASSDLHFYDHCNTTLAVGGMTANDVVIGELWITYDIELFYPQSDLHFNSGTEFASYTSAAGTVAVNEPYGTGHTASSTTNMPLTFGTGGGSNTLYFPVGKTQGALAIYITYTGTATAGAPTIPILTASSGVLNALQDIGFGGSNVPTTIGRYYNLTFSGSPVYLVVDLGTYLGPTTATWNIRCFSLPLRSESTVIFDRQGKMYEERYDKLMDTFAKPVSPVDLVVQVARNASFVLQQRPNEDRSGHDYYLIDMRGGAQSKPVETLLEPSVAEACLRGQNQFDAVTSLIADKPVGLWPLLVKHL